MTVYRTMVVRTLYTKRSWLKSIVCLVRGHRWHVTRTLNATHLKHLHPLIGDDAYCERCGKVSLDYDNLVAVRKRYGMRHNGLEW